MRKKLIQSIASLLLDNPISKYVKRNQFSAKKLNISEHPADKRDWVHVSQYSKLESVDSKEFSRRSSCVRVANQGSIGSCVGHSGRVVLGSASVFKSEEPSPMWIYKTAKKYDPWAGEDYSGTSIRGAASALINEGCCFENFWPYIDSETSTPKDGAKEDAGLKKISSYHVIPCSETEEIKRMVINRPLWYAFKVRDYFFSIGYDGIVDTEKYLASEVAGGHAVSLIGWKYIDDKLYWEFQNSWGLFFGNSGYFFMEDSLFKSSIMNSIGPYYVELSDGFVNPEPIEPEPIEPEPIEPEPIEPEPIEPEPIEPKSNKNLLAIIGAIIILVSLIAYFQFSDPEPSLMNWDKKLDKELREKGKDRDSLLRDYKKQLPR